MLINCPICGKEIHCEAPVCPHCGATFEQRTPSPYFIRSSGNDGSIGLIVFIIAIFLAYYGWNTLMEVGNKVERKQDVWCGYVNKQEKIRIYKPDIKKNGSSICLKGTSFRKSETYSLTFAMGSDFKYYEKEQYREKMVTIYGDLTNKFNGTIIYHKIEISDD